MPGSNNGTGQPLYFHCAMCRKDRWRHLQYERGSGWVATGRVRPIGMTRGGGIRMVPFIRAWIANAGKAGNPAT